MTNSQLSLLNLKYPHFIECAIQTFDDNKTEWHIKDWSLVGIIDQRNFSTEQIDWMLWRQNNKWAWIYFSVNSMEHMSKELFSKINWKYWYRDKQHTTRLNSWICDIDWWDSLKWCRWLPKEKQMETINNAPIKPSMVVESFHWYHLYRFMKDWNEITDDNIENWKRICWWICSHFQWDTKIPNDYSRVLRIPWYLHKKDPSNPFECTIVSLDENYYTTEEMLSAYPNWEQAKKQDDIVERVNKEHKQFMLSNDWTWYNINALDNISMLYEISWKSFVRWEHFDFKKNNSWYQILVDWTPKSCWIDRNWLIWSYDKWWPTWVNWIKYYWIWDEKDIYQYIKENHPECIPEKKKELYDSSIEISEEEITKWSESKWIRFRKWFLYPSKIFDNDFKCFMSWDLVTVVAPSNSWKTTFAMDIIKRNSSNWKKCFYINLEFDISTVPTNRRLWQHWKNKVYLTDLYQLSDEEKEDLDKYVTDYLSQFDYYNNPEWIELSKLVSLIKKKTEEWYELFVIDTFSRIQWNLDASVAHSSQNKSMEVLQALVQENDISILMLHHVNKQWRFEGSQKIMDLSNVFIVINKPMEDDPLREYKLVKDKYDSDKTLELVYDINKWEYKYADPVDASREQGYIRPF